MIIIIIIIINSKQAPSRIIRHHALNDVVARVIQSAGTPVTKEPVGLTRQDIKRPDGLTLINVKKLTV